MSKSSLTSTATTGKAERRLRREVKRLTYELKVAGRQVPLLRAMIDGCADAIALLSLDGEIIEHNQSFQTLMRSDRLLIGHSALRYFHLSPQDTPSTNARVLLTRALLLESQEKPLQVMGYLHQDAIEIRLSCIRDNERLLLVLSARLLSSDDQQARELHRTRLRLHDLHEQLKRQRQIDQTARLESLAMLASTLAHDLNNALSVVSGNLEILQEDLHDDELLELVQDIRLGTQSVHDLVERLRGFSHGPSLMMSNLELISWLNNFIRPVASAHKATLNFQSSELEAWVNVDEGQFSQVILNLITNAIQACESTATLPQLKITVRNAPSGDLFGKMVFSARDPSHAHVLITLRDNGPGIAEETFPSLFEAFYSTRATGSGLGLASVLRIVQLHGGGVSVSNHAQGGAVFTLAIPSIIIPTSRTIEGPLLGADTFHGLQILLMDNDPRVLQIMSRIFRDGGASVTAVHSGQDVIQAYHQLRDVGHRPVCFLDLMVEEGMDGFDVLQILQETWPDVIAVATSGHTELDISRQYSLFGFSAWLPKPFTPQQLHQTVQSFSSVP